MKRDRRRPSKLRRFPHALERLHPKAAGLDCGSAEHVVAVRAATLGFDLVSRKTGELVEKSVS